MDLNTTAFRIVEALTEEKDDTAEKKRESRAKAGKRGGRQRAYVLSTERRKEIALGASHARWSTKHR